MFTVYGMPCLLSFWVRYKFWLRAPPLCGAQAESGISLAIRIRSTLLYRALTCFVLCLPGVLIMLYLTQVMAASRTWVPTKENSRKTPQKKALDLQ